MESASCKLFFELPIDKHLRCGQTRFAAPAVRQTRFAQTPAFSWAMRGRKIGG